MSQKIAVAAMLSVSLIGQRMAAQAMTTECTYVHGPLAGQTQNFVGYPLIPLGSACNDGVSSVGIATAPGVSHPRGAFTMAGGQPSCTDILGTPVTFQPAIAPQQKTGLATIAGNAPVVFIRMADLPNLSPPAVTFLYAHECGHHALGQVIGASKGIMIDRDGELAADCFAKYSVQGLGLLTTGQLQAVYNFIATLPGTPVDYPGPVRVTRIQAC